MTRSRHEFGSPKGRVDHSVQPLGGGNEDGRTLGVVMLDTRFPRRVGDIGNPETFPFPTLYKPVPAATVATVVTDTPLLEDVVTGISVAAAELVEEGADLIATSCGFLAPLQETLEKRVTVPVITSALIMLPSLVAKYVPRPVGVLTIDSQRLAPSHLGVDPSTPVPIEGVETGAELYRVISENRPELDPGRAAQDVIAAALRLVDREPELGAILFECTNFSPYMDQVAATVDQPVYDINGAIRARTAGHEVLGSMATSA